MHEITSCIFVYIQRMKRLFVCCFFLALFCFYGWSQESVTLESFVRQKGDSLLKAEKLPGIFVAVLNGDERRYFSFGYAVPDEKKVFDSTTVFEAGSITKTFTAYVVERVLLEQGITESSSIISYLPDSVQRNKTLSSITFLALLNHTAGLPRLPANLPLRSMTPYDNYTQADLFTYLKTVNPSPDGKSNYSNLGMGLAGVLAQRMAHADYPALLDQYIFRPFGMKPFAEQANGPKAQGYFEGQKSSYWNMAALAPAGALQTSASQLLTYLQYISRAEKENTDSVVKRVLQPSVSVAPTVNVCRAWHTFEQKEKPVIYWHNGGTYGFSSFAAFEKGTGRAVVVVVNKFNANAVSDGLGLAILRKEFK